MKKISLIIIILLIISGCNSNKGVIITKELSKETRDVISLLDNNSVIGKFSFNKLSNLSKYNLVVKTIHYVEGELVKESNIIVVDNFKSFSSKEDNYYKLTLDNNKIKINFGREGVAFPVISYKLNNNKENKYYLSNNRFNKYSLKEDKEIVIASYVYNDKEVKQDLNEFKKAKEVIALVVEVVKK